MVDTMRAAALEHMQRAHDVRLHVGMRIFHGVADAGLCGEVHHPLRPVIGKGLFNAVAVGQISAGKLEVRMSLQALEPGLFQPHVVVVAEIIEPHDGFAAREQSLRRMETDKTRRAGNQDPHRHCPRP